MVGFLRTPLPPFARGGGGPLARERFFFSLERKKNLSQKNSEKDLNLSQTFLERLSNLSLARERFYPHSWERFFFLSEVRLKSFSKQHYDADHSKSAPKTCKVYRRDFVKSSQLDHLTSCWTNHHDSFRGLIWHQNNGE